MKVTLAQAGIVAGILTLSWVVGGPKDIYSAPPTKEIGMYPHTVFNSTVKAHAEKVATLVPDSIVSDNEKSGTQSHWYVLSTTSYDEARPYFIPWLKENNYFRTNQFLSEVKYEAESFGAEAQAVIIKGKNRRGLPEDRAHIIGQMEKDDFTPTTIINTDTGNMEGIGRIPLGDKFANHRKFAESFSAEQSVWPLSEEDMAKYKSLVGNTRPASWPSALAYVQDTLEEVLTVRTRPHIVVMAKKSIDIIENMTKAESHSAEGHEDECGGTACPECGLCDCQGDSNPCCESHSAEDDGELHCQNCGIGSHDWPHGMEEITIYNKWGDEGDYAFCGDGCEGQWMRENSMTYDIPEDEDMDAESKLPPAEKAGITGVASGATMEGLETLLSEPYDGEDCPLCLDKIDFTEAYEYAPLTLCDTCSEAVMEKRFDHAYSAEDKALPEHIKTELREKHGITEKETRLIKRLRLPPLTQRGSPRNPTHYQDYDLTSLTPAGWTHREAEADFTDEQREIFEQLKGVDAYGGDPNWSDKLYAITDKYGWVKVKEVIDTKKAAEGDVTEDLAEVRTDLSQKRTNMSALRTALSVAGLFLVWDSWRWSKEERKLKGL